MAIKTTVSVLFLLTSLLLCLSFQLPPFLVPESVSLAVSTFQGGVRPRELRWGLGALVGQLVRRLGILERLVGVGRFLGVCIATEALVGVGRFLGVHIYT